ncbi:MAG: peptidoglycan editing factor PgeF [Bryobacterales bacterium]|nr:peptidoglycan editing factor PgeF [Bryobacterales bacterium]
MFILDSDNVYRARPLMAFDWLEHGFGTRHSPEFGIGAEISTLKQIHSAVCIPASAGGCLGEGDALVASAPGRPVSVRTADCLPILMADGRQRTVAAVHAGWRGTIQGIVAKVARMLGRAEDLHVAIGPGIGHCCFEVGPEVAGQFADLFPERCDLRARTSIDLLEANRRQLIQAGVPGRQIYQAGLCTVCGEAFHSFRRDRERAGRMVSMISRLE